MAEPYHEPQELLSAATQDIHRALNSAIEELEAIDWYHQRAQRATDPELKAVIEHNRNEEIEHATMLLEWLRRTMPEFDGAFRTYLFTEVPITEIEEQVESAKSMGQEVIAGVKADLGIGRGNRG